MDKKELVVRLLKMDERLSIFINQLCNIGLDTSASIIEDIDPIELIAEIYGFETDDLKNFVSEAHQRIFPGVDCYSDERVKEFIACLDEAVQQVLDNKTE